jgi:hypothetical protein
MTEDAPSATEPFKIWRNPDEANEPIAYMGDFYPPGGCVVFVAQDLVELGFGPGEYTVRIPESFRRSGLFAKWQRVRIGR